MTYQGSCHCGNITFEVDGTFEHVIECDCSHCQRKGYLLWFVPAAQFRLTAQKDMRSYWFNKHVIEHHFCANCGCAPMGIGKSPDGAGTVAVNIRCLNDIDLSTVTRVPYDGKSV